MPDRTGVRPGGAIMDAGGILTIDLAIHDATAPAGRDEQQLVAAVLAGDKEAFRGLVERESAAVVRACQRILGDRGEAEDAAQEAFVTAYRALGTWRRDGPWGAWVARIAVRTALRQAAQRRTVAWIDPVDTPGARTTLARDTTGDPAVHAMRAERSIALRSAVARLDEPYRETVALRFFAERSLAEISAETGRPLGTVKTHLHRGLQRLRSAIGERGADL